MSAKQTAEDFLTLVDKLGQFIQAHHKMDTLPQQPEDKLPPFLEDAEKYLVRIISPSRPSIDTAMAARKNARSWVSATLTLLQDHYLRIRQETIADITPLLVPDWNRALLVAIRQSRRRSPRIRDSTFEATRRMLSDIMSPSFPLSTPDAKGADSLPRPPPTQPPTPPSLPHLPQRPPRNGSPTPATPVGEANDGPSSRATATVTNPPPLTLSPSAAATGTDARPPLPLSPVIDIVRPTENVLSGSPVCPRVQSPPPPASASKKPRFDIDSVEESLLQSLLEDFPVDVPAPVPPPGPSSPENTTPAARKPTGSLRQVPLFTSHSHTGDKFTNWALWHRRPLLIMGDSNLARLPEVHDVRVQIDSFPGAKIAHAAHVLHHKTRPSPVVTSVVLSFGINDKETANPSLLAKSLGSLYNAAKLAFPSAVVYMPLLNCSDALPPHIQHNVSHLNELIKSHNSFIPRLSKQQFQTTQDNVHWTPETARLMWKHWRDFLE